jgi:hypothetical protein
MRYKSSTLRETTRIDLGYSNTTLLVKIRALYLIWVNQVKHERSDVVDELMITLALTFVSAHRR